MNYGNKYYSTGGALTREKITSIDDEKIFIDVSVSTEMGYPIEILKEEYTKEQWIKKKDSIDLSPDAKKAINDYFSI